MAIPQAQIPQYTIQQPDVMANYGKMVALRNMLAQSKEIPLDLQIKQQQAAQAQEQTTQSQIATQQAQLQQKSQAAMVQALSDPDFGKEIGTSGTAPSGNGLGFDPDAMTQGLIKRGVLPKDALSFTSSLVDRSEKVSEATKNNADATSAAIGNYSKSLDSLSSLISPILDMPASEAAQAFQNFKAKLAASPIPGMSPQDLQVIQGSTLEQLPAVANFLGIEGRIADYHKTQADALKGTAEAQQAARAAATPSQQQLSDALSTVATYQASKGGAMPDNMATAFANEIKNAPDWGTLQKVQARADAAQESFQRSQDALKNAEALKNVAMQQVVAGKLVAQDQTLSANLAGSKGIRDELNMSNGGNEVAAAAALQRFAEHEVAEGGIKRFNELEQKQLISGVGDYGRRFQAWADKGFDPKQIPPATNAEINTILDNEDQIARAQHDQNVGDIVYRYSPEGMKAKGAAPAAATKASATGMVTMKAPDGTTKQVSADQVAHYKSLGATVVETK